MIAAMTQAKTVLESKEGGLFSYFDGQITGAFKELIPCEKIVSTWRMKEWEDDVYSNVEIKLYSDEYGVTTLELHQT